MDKELTLKLKELAPITRTTPGLASGMQSADPMGY
jgi:hypothetical protein